MHIPVIPLPAHSKLDPGSVLIDSNTSIDASSAELESVSETFKRALHEDSGFLIGGGSSSTTRITLTLSQQPDLVPVAAGLRADGAEVDERYTIMSSSEHVRIEGATPEAVHRGLTTLRQIIVANASNGSVELPYMYLADGPRFAWRGVLIDVARTYYRPDALRRVIDMCSLYKLNVLHLHLTDDQGWRLDVPTRPELSAIGSLPTSERGGGFYTQEDIAGLVEYAAARFVTIVPEIDMPGHSAAVFRAYPALPKAEGPDIDLPTEYREMLNNLDPDSEETWALVKDVVDAVVTQFPQSAYVHLGGDEPFGMKDEDHASFVEQAIQVVRQRGRKVIGWQEIARAAIDEDTVVQYWMHASDAELEQLRNGGLDSIVPTELLPFILASASQARGDLPSALERGAKILVSPTQHLYFDRPHPGPAVDEGQEEQRRRVGMPAYPPLSLHDGFDWDPIGTLPGVLADENLAGIEGAVWSETLETAGDLEFMLIPRICGLSEKAWGQRDQATWIEFQRRLNYQTSTWDHRKWNWYNSSELLSNVEPSKR